MGIYVWGTGCGAGELIEQGLTPEQITAFIDNAPSYDTFLERPVIKPEQLSIKDVQLLIISTRHAEVIRNQCLSLGLKPENLLFLKNHYLLSDLNESYEIAEKLLGKEILADLCYPCHIIREPAGMPDSLPASAEKENDYVRVKTLEMLSSAAASIPGAVAELGVYRGGFARIINQLFPERTLHLFDTFDGFEANEAEQELKAQTCGEAFLQAHKNTAAERVMKIMPYPENIQIHQGYFPESLGGLEERFALVSLDVDFEETTYAGLSYFWPRLNSGGYLLLHDYNSPTLSGVKKAVQRYEADHQMRFPSVPLCDVNGTLILCKP